MTSTKRQPTDQQRQIIDHFTGSAEVIAGPGTGKSATLVQRVKHLIRQHGVDPKQITVLSFNANTAEELRTKIANSEVTVSTFHAAGYAWIRSYYRLLGFTAAPQYLGNADRAKMLTRIVDQLCPDAPKYQVFAALSWAANSLQKIEAFIPRRFPDCTPFIAEIKKVRREFRSEKRLLNVLDDDDMLRLALRLLRRHPKIVDQLPFDFLLVDEFQDTNRVQALILKKIGITKPNIVVFGDPAQAIYGFRGASEVRLAELLPDSAEFQLTHSFRCTHEICELANAVRGEQDGVVLAATSSGSKPHLIAFDSPYDQAQQVLRIVEQAIRDEIAPNEIAVLARERRQLYDLEDYLVQAAVPFTPLYRSVEPKYRQRALRLFSLATTIRQMGGCKPSEARPLLKPALLNRLANNQPLEPSKLVEVTRILSRVNANDKPERRMRIANKAYLKILRATGQRTADIQRELRSLEQHARACQHSKRFRRRLEQLDQPSIHLSTIHGAKGLEWSVVIVLHVVDGNLPHAKSVPNRVEEEQRLLYVAITRAKRYLYLLQAPAWVAGKRRKLPSRFLADVEDLVA